MCGGKLGKDSVFAERHKDRINGVYFINIQTDKLDIHPLKNVYEMPYYNERHLGKANNNNFGNKRLAENILET